MSFLKKLNLDKKLWLIIGSSLACIIALITLSLFSLKRDLLREREHITRQLVECAYSVLNHYHSMELSGEMSRKQAQQGAIAAIKDMRFRDEDSEYFWINDMRATMIMHPIRPELNGKDLSSFKDPAGKMIFIEFVKTVEANKGGFVYYLWPKPGFSAPVQKLSYVMGFDAWGWVVGSGMYLDDVTAVFWRNARSYTQGGMILFGLIVGTCWPIAKNITRTEAALRKSEEKFFKAFHAAPDGIVISRKSDGLYSEANEAFFNMVGYARDEIIGRSSLELGIWADPKQRTRIVDSLDVDQALQENEIRIRTKSGDIRTILWFPDIIILNGEECIIAVLHDITKQKEYERQILKSKAEITVKHEQLSAMFTQVESVKKQWERTMDCINDMVILLDREGMVLRCNRATAEFVGVPYKDIAGVVWQNLTQLPGAPSGGFGSHCYEYFHQDLDRWFQVTCYPYTEHDYQENSGAVITIHDTTETKQAAREVENAYAELKAAHSQLLQQEKMASIGQLAAGVAHEINNPTGFIISNLGTLGKYTDRLASFLRTQSATLSLTVGEEEKDKLAALRKQLKIDHIVGDLPNLIAESLEGAERVKKIVQDMKSFSRVDEADSKPANLIECLESTINIVWNEIRYKATLKRQYEELPFIRCKPQQLNQVFLNLLVNAADAIGNQGEITVRTWQEPQTVCISIADTGYGIPKEHLSRIFEPFFTTKEVGKGTGLGLSISYDIIKKHHGELMVESETGKGTVFTIRLPATGEGIHG